MTASYEAVTNCISVWITVTAPLHTSCLPSKPFGHVLAFLTRMSNSVTALINYELCVVFAVIHVLTDSLVFLIALHCNAWERIHWQSSLTGQCWPLRGPLNAPIISIFTYNTHNHRILLLDLLNTCVLEADVHFKETQTFLQSVNDLKHRPVIVKNTYTRRPRMCEIKTGLLLGFFDRALEPWPHPPSCPFCWRNYNY